MEITGDHVKKIRDIKGTLHAKMSTIKDRKQKQKILRRGGKNTQSYTKTTFMTWITTMV